MQSQQRSLMLILILLALLIAFGSTAQPFIPDDKQQIVASWDNITNTPSENMSMQQLIDKTNWHIHQGQYAGQANKHYGRARALLAPLFEQPNKLSIKAENRRTQSQLHYLWARILQHQHQFSEAQQVLEQAIELDPGNSSAILLKASVLLVQGKYQQSKQACTQMVGHTDITITIACVLEANANIAEPGDSYQQLSSLLNKRAVSDPQQNWLVQLVADMALRLNKPQEAAQWLESALSDEQTIATKPLSFIVLWADVQLALKHEQQVLNELTDIVEQADFKDDALLTRLSIAEKSTGANRWQHLLTKRIELRLARQDNYHSADLARYYLDIKPDAQQAMYWAQLNWQRAKLHDDKILLDRALMMQNSGFEPDGA